MRTRDAALFARSVSCAIGLASTCLANGWQPLTNQPPANAGTMLLLTDGRVLLSDRGTGDGTDLWWILTPDIHGSYVNGTWSAAASTYFARMAFASAVLADGRVVVAGGEYAGSSDPVELDEVEIYDPVGDFWTTLDAPAGWNDIGDAPASLLADGRLLLGSIDDARTAIYDPRYGWSAGPDKLNVQSTEESWVLLPDGSVLTVDCVGHPGSQRYDPSLGLWVDCGSLPVDLVEAASLEIGPAILMNDGRVFFMGATPHCALYTPPTNPGDAGTWVQGSDPPLENVNGAMTSIGAKDGPACLLPNGNVLCALGPVDGVEDDYLGPTFYFEFDGATFNPITGFIDSNPPGDQSMLLLPTGEVLLSDGAVYAYSCDGGPDSNWKPAVSSVDTTLVKGRRYKLTGTQLNGLSQAVGYGDDLQAATNYPLVRLTSKRSGHVFYCRTFEHSTMAVATGDAPVSTNFLVSDAVEPGPASLEVIANGIASDAVDVLVKPDDGRIERVSVGAAGAEGDGSVFVEFPAASGNGRYIAFASYADDLVASDGNHSFDVFVRDRLSGSTDCVSVDSSGAIGDFDSWDPSISSDGRFVAFSSGANNLVPGVVANYFSIFVHDRVTGVTECDSVDSGGALGDDGSAWPSISADGRWAAFTSLAGNLAPGTVRETYNVFVHDREGGTTQLVSANATGAAGDGYSFGSAITADGRYVAFMSTSDDLVPGDANGFSDIFLRDVQNGTTELVSVDSAGIQANGDSRYCAISSDGRFVAFNTDATDLAPGAPPGQVYVRDRAHGTTECVSVSSSATFANVACGAPSISGDGRFVAFSTSATNLVGGDTNGKDDVFVHDRTTGTTLRISESSSGSLADGSSQWPQLSSDGRLVAFASLADNLVSGDTNACADVFASIPNLTLDADPPVPTPGSTLTLSLWQGGSGTQLMVAIVGLNGVPLFSPLVFSNFDVNGVWTLSNTVPAGLSGNSLTLQAFGFIPSGKPDSSNPATIRFQ
jgi:Tol biopolymer transport system component